ncbi:MAG: hypothetical protein A2297_00360 [Elusimicrobia bacterium RIFOXYB2_FULL_48_7]|nr:MAG: hypothetical protein A2297_00360 [Elusimicrobia bacterium RIFOXYB2_FULL_48_7]
MTNSLLNFSNKAVKTLILSLLSLPFIAYSKYNYDIFGLPKETLFQFLVLLIWIFWLIKIIAEKKVVLVKSKVNVFALFFLGINAVSILWTGNFHLSSVASQKLVFYVLLYFIAANLIDEEAQLNSILIILISTACFESIYGLLQFLKIDPVFQSGLAGRRRIIGTFGYHNFVSEYLILIIPVMFACCFLKIRRYLKILLYCAIVVSLLCVILTQTRSTWIALICSITIFSIVLGKRSLKTRYKKFVLSLLCAVFITAAFAFIFSSNYAVKSKKDSIKSRLLIYESALLMIKDRPLLGAGAGTFEFNYSDYLSKVMKNRQYTIFVEEVTSAHNEYLQTWTETGILGLIIYLCLFYFFFREGNSLYAALNTNQQKHSILLLSFMSAIIGFLVDSIFSFPLHIAPAAITMWFLLGLSASLKNLQSGEPGKQYHMAYDLNPKITGLLGIITICLVIFFSNTFKTFLADYYWDKADCAAVNSDWNESVSNYRKALRLDEDNGKLHFFYGSMLLNMGEIDKGIEELNIAQKNFKDHHLYNNLGRACLEKKDYLKAEHYYKLAAETKTFYISDLNNLAAVYIDKKELDKAIEVLKETVRIRTALWAGEVSINDERFIMIDVNLGLAYFKKGMLKEAENTFINALTFASEPEKITVLNSLGLVYMQMDKTNEAIKCFNKILLADKNNIQAYNNLGSAYYKINKYALAAKYWKQSLSIDPNNEVALHNISKLKLSPKK